MLIDRNINVFVQSNLAKTPPEVDESKFITQGEMSIDALKDSRVATIVFSNQSPSEAWNNYVNSTTGSMIEVSSTIPTAFNDVAAKLSSILEENGITPVVGMSIKHAIPESEEGDDPDEIKTAEFIVGGVEYQYIKKEIEAILNADNYAGFEDYFLALDKLSAAENTGIASARDAVLGNNRAQNSAENSTDLMTTYGYEQDFSLKYLANNWQMDTSVERVERLRIEKIATRV